MGTHSAVGFPTGNGGFQGRYVNWDGYPSAMATNLAEIIQRDGIERAVRTLTLDHHGWSAVNGVGATDERDSKRFVGVDGYGTAYTAEEQDDSWIYETDGKVRWDVEWAYAMTQTTIMVWENTDKGFRRLPEKDIDLATFETAPE